MRYIDYIYRYVNGNYLVTLTEGNILVKEALRMGEELISDFPDSIDLKITNKCSNGCPFCHESSTKEGKTFDVGKTISILDQLPRKPIEIAIGGGNILECVDEVEELVDWLISNEFRVRCTIRLEDYLKASKKEINLLSKFEAIGLSISGNLPESIMEQLKNKAYRWSMDFILKQKFVDEEKKNEVDPELPEWAQPRVKYIVEDNKLPIFVVHAILGITPLYTIKLLVEHPIVRLGRGNIPILLLGYKQWGRAKNTELPPEIKDLEKYLKQMLIDYRNHNQLTTIFAFDNLAINQLNLQNALLVKEYNEFFMGREGEHSMYIDAVTGIYSKNSCSPERVSWDSIGLIDFFKSI